MGVKMAVTKKQEKQCSDLTTSNKIANIKSKQIPKSCSGISGLDEVLHGGFPKNRTTLIKGSAGTGKTILGLEFLYRSALNNEPVIFVCFEETAETIRQNAMALGWNIEALEKSGKFFLWEAKIDRDTVISGDFSINSLLAAIKGKAEQMNASLIMIDAIDVLMRIFEDPVKERNELYRLHDWLVEQQFTTLLTAKVDRDPEAAYRYELLDYMTDCVLLLDTRVVNQVTTRRLRIIKYRGSLFCSNEYPYIITSQGNVIMPITAMELAHRPTGEKITTGNTDLDNLLGGGFAKGSSILISGPTGSGKTTLAATFTQRACSKGGNILYISFEESKEAIVSAMLSPGIDLQPAIEKGNLEFHTIMPEALVPEEHLYRILQKIEQFQPEHIVVDAISACERMSTEQAAFDFLVRLIDICKQRNITSLMTNQLKSNEQKGDISGIGISSIIDTLITLKFIEIENEINRDLVIVKSRGTHHSNRHHLYSITDHGISISNVKTGTGGQS